MTVDRRGIVAAVAATFALSGCSAIQLPSGTATLDPIAFFTGKSSGRGSLDTLIASPVDVTVESVGTPVPGGLRLVQRIREGSKRPRVRVWIIRKGEDGVYSGTLTDAKGEVWMRTQGPIASITYHTPSGLRIDQQLALQQDGRTILNRLEARRFGIRLAVLNETIRK
ncbi:DUF3833 family protein [Sphingomonas humi]|uniref:DUF3833 family protein n=1 Tax=Sphingomonas humi TaxID=335630 RepID=UPI0031D0AF73